MRTTPRERRLWVFSNILRIFFLENLFIWRIYLLKNDYIYLFIESKDGTHCLGA